MAVQIVTTDRIASTMREVVDGPVSISRIASRLGLNYNTLYTHLCVRGAKPETVRQVAVALEDVAKQSRAQARDLRRAARGLPRRTDSD